MHPRTGLVASNNVAEVAMERFDGGEGMTHPRTDHNFSTCLEKTMNSHTNKQIRIPPSPWELCGSSKHPLHYMG
jgi:hypothetical protein